MESKQNGAANVKAQKGSPAVLALLPGAA